MEASTRAGGRWLPRTEEERVAVLHQLDVLLRSQHFRNSSRYTAFLEYVVRETIDGRGDSLKERTLGVEIFNRSPNYDTNNDPIVRVTAGQIRKRLALWYMEENHPAGIRIDLPAGSYVPMLQIIDPPEAPSPGLAAEPAESALQADAAQTFDPVQGMPFIEDPSSTDNAELPQSVAVELVHSQEPAQAGQPSTEPRVRTQGLRKTVGLSMALLATVAILLWLSQMPASQIHQMWTPVLSTRSPILLLMGQPHDEQLASTAVDSVFRRDHEPGSQMFFSDGITLGRICNTLGAHPYEILPSRSVSIADFRNRPIVLIGAFSNPWTLRLLQPLRFHLEIAGNGNIDTPQVMQIVDRKKRKGSPWTVDFRQPINTMTHDYAVIARFHDDTTENLVVVAAGIGATGTQSAGEFITSPAYMEQFARLAPRDWSGTNMEAVIETEVIDGEVGHPHIVAAEFW
jgi:hypothetical protein